MKIFKKCDFIFLIYCPLQILERKKGIEVTNVQVVKSKNFISNIKETKSATMNIFRFFHIFFLNNL